MIPKSKRKFIYSIYAFARTADNIADSRYLMPEEKFSKLEFMEDLLENFSDYEKIDIHFKNVFTALTDTIEEAKIDRTDLKYLLNAFKQDVTKKRYEKFSELLDYSKYSANPVGHLVLQIFGYDKEKNKNLFILSDYICSALQFANFWQDVSLDLKLNRVYVPTEIMAKYNYNIEDFYTKVENDKFKRVMKELVQITEEMFEKGKELPVHLNGRLRVEISATINGGMKVLNLIKKSNYKVLSYRVKLNKLDKFKIFLSSIF